MTFPDKVTPIRTPLPPMLPDMASIVGESQFIGMFYQGSKATWSDGRISRTFNFYQVWQPLTSHPAIAIPLSIALYNCPPPNDDWTEPGLGSDDFQATHMLIIDRDAMTMAIAPWIEGMEFLNQQHPPLPPLSPEEQEAVRAAMLKQLQAMHPDLMNEPLSPSTGMFELFIRPDPALVEQSKQMVKFLDNKLDPQIKQILQRFAN
jgi:hypothetical protein